MAPIDLDTVPEAPQQHSRSKRAGNAVLAAANTALAYSFAAPIHEEVAEAVKGHPKDIISAAASGFVAYRFARGAERRGKAVIRGHGSVNKELEHLRSLDSIEERPTSRKKRSY